MGKVENKEKFKKHRNNATVHCTAAEVAAIIASMTMMEEGIGTVGHTSRKSSQ